MTLTITIKIELIRINFTSFEALAIIIFETAIIPIEQNKMSIHTLSKNFSGTMDKMGKSKQCNKQSVALESPKKL